MRSSSLFAGVLCAGALFLGAGCPDDGDSRRPIGASCDDNAACVSGLCLSQRCVDPAEDDDLDGLINSIEAALGTNPFEADTDGDGVGDRDELDSALAHVDSDGDQIADALESAIDDRDDDCIPDQLDPNNDTSDGDLSPLIPKLCLRDGVCGAEGATLSVECPGDASTAVCVYGEVPGYEADEVTCDELDNDCDGSVDEELDCTPEPFCGDGIVDEDEACDEGADSNGTSVCGCQTNCEFAGTDVECRAGGECDTAEMCDGAGACPEDALAEDDSSCSGCDGGACVCDAGVCVDACGNGVIDEGLGEACDEGDQNGASTCGCQSDCQYAGSDVVCREAGVCDTAELCDGQGGCPDDALADEGSDCVGCDNEPCQCEAGACVDKGGCGDGVVDESLGEACDEGDQNGASTCGCQSNCQYAASDVVCREAGVCDTAELCDGQGGCPDDVLADEGSDCVGCDAEPCQCESGACVIKNTCGDALVNEGQGEVCDDGAMNGARDLCNQSCSAQCDFDFVWVTAMGGAGVDESLGLDIDAGGNAITGGVFKTTSAGGPASFGSDSFVSRSDSSDLWVSKVDPTGAVQWTGCAASPGNDNFEGIAVGPSGEVLIAGGYTGEAWFDCCDAPAAASCANVLPSAGGDEDVLVAKWSADGTFQWAFGGGSPSSDAAYGITVDPSGNAIVISDTHAGSGASAVFGDIALPGNGTGQFVIFKLDPNGDVLWAKLAGGAGQEWSEAVEVDSVGNIYVTGSSSGSFTWDGQLVNSGSTDSDAIVAKLDAQGRLVWAATAGGANEQAGGALAINAVGEVVVTGGFVGGIDFGTTSFDSTQLVPNEDLFIAKLDAQGEWLWAVTAPPVPDVMNDADFADAVVFDRAGDLYVAGEFSGALSFGDEVLEAAPPSPEPAGDNPGGPQAGNVAGFVAKLSGAGDFLWAKRMGGQDFNIASGVRLSPQGHLFVSGALTTPAQFDAIEVSASDLPASGESDAFVARMEPDDLADGCFQCGDGVQDPGEACDEADGGDHCTGSCDGTCTGPANSCGDGWVQCGELYDVQGMSTVGMCTYSIVGTWIAKDDPNDFLVIVFLADGTYLHAEVDFDDASEVSGMERGAYTYDLVDGRVTVNQAGYSDNNGDTGLTEFTAGSQGPFGYMTPSGDELTVTVDEDGNGTIDGTVVFERAPSSGLVGTWLYRGAVPEFLLVTFFDDGTYLHAEVDPLGSPPVNGMEWGTYTHNTSNGQLTATQSFDNNSDAGITDYSSTTETPFLFVEINGDVLDFTIVENPGDTVNDMIDFARQP